METPLYPHKSSQLQFELKNYTSYVNNFELASILAQPRICSSNRLEAMVSWREKDHSEMANKTLMNVALKVWRQITLQYLENPSESMLRHMAAVVEANGGHTKYQ